jgi:hypothetical protein
MGGRKTYKLEEVVGITRKNAKERQQLLTSIKSEEPKEIVKSALALALKSDKLIENLTKATKVFEFIQEKAEATPLNYSQRKRLAAEYWAKKKKEENYSSNSKVDSIIVDSLTKYIYRGKGK